jgi:dethiobiotin synthetase
VPLPEAEGSLRPARLVVVAGTGTEVGKTWASARALAVLRDAGLVVSARKPAQSFEPGETTDAEVLGEATGEDPKQVCPEARWLPVPLAPPMAADALGLRPFTLSELLPVWAPGTELGLVETAGGVRSPLAVDGDCAAYAHLLEPDHVLLVADAGLGTINSVRLSVEALAPLPVKVLLNRFDPEVDVHRRNRAWLHDADGLDVATTADEAWERGVL